MRACSSSDLSANSGGGYQHDRVHVTPIPQTELNGKGKGPVFELPATPQRSDTFPPKMANASAKRLAASNKQELLQFHRISIAVYGATFIFFRFFNHSVIMQAFMCIPALGAEYLIDLWCRPTYGAGGQVVRSGHDFNQGGVTEYLKDIVYLTWCTLVLSALIGFKAWWLQILIPIYASKKAAQLLKAGKQLLSGPNNAPGQASEVPPAQRR